MKKLDGELRRRALGRAALRRISTRYAPWAVVTGASSGIGREFALHASAAGLNTVLVGRNAAALNRVDAEIAASGRSTRIVIADLASADGVDAACRATSDLDVGLFVAAAGFGTTGDAIDGDDREERAMLAVNCEALYAMTIHYARRFTDRGRGGIALMSSLVGRQGAPGAAHYAATKAYVQALAEGLHLELRPRGVDVIASAPGPVHSGFADRAGMTMTVAATADQVAAGTLRRLGHRMTVTPGRLSGPLTWALGPLPRPARARVMRSVMHGLISGA